MIILTLTIEQSKVGVDGVAVFELAMVPNPVRVSEVLTVVGEFSEVERQGLIVTVLNAVGQKVYEDEPSTCPILIEGLQQRGVYIVRIVTGTGDVRQGKVIVE